jgi:glycosyltransferase involved in cell wall biosynthesis
VGAVTDLSVIVCSHNPRQAALTRTLASLRGQTLQHGVWELLLVDNASQPVLEQSWRIDWHERARHIREEELGLTPARLRGIREAKGALILFVDDDNELRNDYLSSVMELARLHQHVGALGAGVLRPEFEAEPDPELGPLLPMLALRSVSHQLWTNNCSDTACTPWGAGLCVRASVARRYLDVVGRLATAGVLDRRGASLFCGGDDLFSWCSAAEGLGFGIFPQLQITHLISAQRLSREYFLRLVRDHAFSHTVLRYLVFGELPSSASYRTWFRCARQVMTQGTFSMRIGMQEVAGTAQAGRYISELALQPLSGLTVPRSSPGILAR